MLPEREKLPVTERPEEVSSLTIERKEVVQPVPANFKAQVQDDTGRNVISTPQSQAVSMVLPASQTQLTQLAKGNIVNSLTWFAVFWLRMVKKALHFGWNTVVRGGTKGA